MSNPEWAQVMGTGMKRPARSVIRFASRISTSSLGNSLCGADGAGVVMDATDSSSGRGRKTWWSESGSEDTRSIPRMGAGVPLINTTVCDCGSIFLTNPIDKRCSEQAPTREIAEDA